MTHTAEQMSRRFDFLRLHRWAWDRRAIRKPRPLQEEKEDKRVVSLLRQLLQHRLRRAKIAFALWVEQGQEALLLEFEQPLQILRSLTQCKVLPGQLQWDEAQLPVRRVLRLPLRQGPLWCASEQFLALEQFLRGETPGTSEK